MPLLSRVALAAIAATTLPHPLSAQGPGVDPQPVLFTGRTVDPTADAQKRFPAARPAIETGLQWLMTHQDKDGRWNSDEFAQHDGAQPTDGPGRATNDVATTGLALLALARKGPAAAGDPRRQALLRGGAWLTKQQRDKDGLLGEAAAHDYVYGHAIGTLGLCAVVAATGDAAQRDAAQAAVNHLEKHRNPYSVWRYQPRDNDNDTSVTTWASLAYLAAHELGLKINRQALVLARAWIEQVTDEGGRTGYSRRGEWSSRSVANAKQFPPDRGEAMTAAGLLVRQAIGDRVEDHEIMRSSVQLLLAKPPTWQPKTGHVDYCYWFFGTEALRRVGGEAFDTWSGLLVDALTKNQRADGTAIGSWDPVDPWGEDGGRIYATAMSVLALQAVAPLPGAAPAGAGR